MAKEEASKSEETSDSESTKDESPTWTIWTAVSYAVVMLLIGVPLWWKTTTVQRVPLPYGDMLSLHEKLQSSFRIQVPINLKGFSAPLAEDEEVKAQSLEGYSFNFRYLKPSGEELDALYKAEDIYAIDKLMCKLSKADDTNSIDIYFLGRAEMLKEIGRKLIIGNCRTIYYISNSGQPSFELVWETLRKVVGVGLAEKSTDIVDVRKEPVLSDDDELQLPLSAGYNILFSLLVPEPEVLDAMWNFEKAEKDYLKPMLDKMAPFAEFSVRSQLLYYIKLNLYPVLNQKTGLYEIPYDQLPLVINPVESRLTSYVSQNPAINFLIYVAPCDKAPLQILDEDGLPLESNAFFVPQWGGIFIYNAPCKKTSNVTEIDAVHKVSMDKVMSVIISQYRSLIGLPETAIDNSVLEFRGSALRDWEVDMIVRKRLRNLLFTAANTLNSLGKLLDKITNIVVTEEVGGQVESSVQDIKDAFIEAAAGRLKIAQTHAISAFKASEIAFHHPKNLAQLYFPDDQKYAIYIPLFLPVGIPVILSLRLIFASFRKVKEAKVKSD